MRSALRWLGFAFIALFVFSCAAITGRPKEIHVDHTTRYTLHVDDRFATADRAVVVDSFIEWERDTHGVVKFAVAPQKWNFKTDDMDFSVDDESGCTVDVYVASIDSKHQSIRDMEKQPHSRGNTLGYTSRSCEQKVVAFVMDRVKANKEPNTLRFVGVHEAGHLVGLDHIPVPHESVMFPSMDNATMCPTSLDMKQFCLLYGCDWHDMKACD